MAAPQKPRRGLKIVAVCCVLGVALIGVAELVARSLVPKIAEQSIRKELKLPDTHPVEVSLQGMVLPQLLAGKFQDAAVLLDDYQIAPGLSGSVRADLAEVALNPLSQPLSGATARITLTDDQFTAFLKSLAPDYIDSAQVRNDIVTLRKTFAAFGSEVPAEATVTLAADNGQLQVTAKSITAGGVTVEPEKLGALVGGSLSDLIGRFGGSNSFCISDRLPAGVMLADITARRGVIAVTFNLHPELLRDSQLQQPGTC